MPAVSHDAEDETVLTPEDIRKKLFSVVRLREGYDQRQVDDFLDRAVAEISSRVARRDSSEAPSDPIDSASLPVALTSAETLTTTFDTVRLRAGYEQSEVDDFLREVASTLDQLEADLRRHGVRIRAQPQAPAL